MDLMIGTIRLRVPVKCLGPAGVGSSELGCYVMLHTVSIVHISVPVYQDCESSGTRDYSAVTAFIYATNEVTQKNIRFYNCLLSATVSNMFIHAFHPNQHLRGAAPPSIPFTTDGAKA